MKHYKLLIIIIAVCVFIPQALADQASMQTSALSCYDFQDNALDQFGRLNMKEVGGITYSDTSISGRALLIENNKWTKNDSIPNSYVTSIRTICFWKRPTSVVHGLNYITIKNPAPSGINEWYISQYTDGANIKNRVLFKVGNVNKVADLSSNKPHVNKWDFYCNVINSTHNVLYVNSTKVMSKTVSQYFTNDFTVIGTGNSTNLVDECPGQMDSLMIFNMSLEPSDVQLLYNSGSGRNCSYLTTIAPATPMDIFVNVTAYNTTLDYKNYFDSGEDFFIEADYHFSDGIRISGQCNITIPNSSVETDIATNFSLCTSGCNYSTYVSTISPDPTNAYTYMDAIHFNACYPQTLTGGITVNVSCVGGEHIFILNASNIPSCTSTNPMFFLETDVCIAQNSVTININPLGAPSSKRTQISNLALDRFSIINENEFGVGVIYNISTNVSYTNHTHEYYYPGVYTVDVNCSNSGVNQSSGTIDLHISNYPPIITLGGILTDIEFAPVGQNLNYSDSNYSLIYSVEDIDLSWVYYELHNSSDIIGSGNTSDIPQFNSSNFRDFQANEFMVIVKAGDENGSVTTATFNFSVVDVVFPFCSGLNDVTRDNNTVYVWNVNCYDEAIFSFNLSCDNGYSSYVEGLNGTTYHFGGNITLLGDTSCDYEYCDGHTANELSQNFHYRKINDSIETELKGKINKITVLSDNSTITVHKKKDRISYTVTFPKGKGKQTYRFMYEASDKSYYLSSNVYEAWIVDAESKTWFDMNHKGNNKITVTQTSRRTYEIVVETTSNSLTFESIGELNCITGTQNIHAYVEGEEYFVADLTLSSVIFIVALIMLVLFLTFISFYAKVPALLIIVAVMYWFIGIVILKSGLPYFYYIIGIAMFPVGIVMVGSAIGLSRR